MSQRDPTQHEIDVYCAQWILNGGDQSKAWRVAYPESTMTDANVNTKACNMHKMVKVRSRLDQLQSETAAKDAVEFDMSVTDLKGYLKRVMDAGLEEDDSGKRGGLSATNGAIAEWNRMNGNHATVKTINANVDLSELSDEALDAKIKMLSTGD